MAEPTFRLRVTYAKKGRLRFLSHLEVTRACERSVRRAQLEYAVSKGFNPRMRIAFGPALPVGTAGLAESYDVWLTGFVRVTEALKRLGGTTPEELGPHEAVYVGETAPSLAASLVLADYELKVLGAGLDADVVRTSLDNVIALGRLQLEHKGKPRVYDLPTCLPAEPVVGSISGGAEVRMTTRMGAWGSLRPEYLISAALGDRAADVMSLDVTRLGLRTEG